MNNLSQILKNRTVIGIDLGATNVRVARICEDKIDQIEIEEIVDSDEPADLLVQIQKLIQIVNNDEVQSIGIGVPSVVDVEKGIVYDVQNISSWNKVPVKKILEEKFGKPVYVNNDANCFVLGERFFGKGRGYHSIVGLTIGSGLGAGLILDDCLYSGPNCGAGEVGMFPYMGTFLEQYCSGMFFEGQFAISAKQAFEKAQNGDDNAKGMYEAFGTHLGNGIKATLYAYDPQLIILGGSISRAYPFFKDTMKQAMEDFAYPNSLEALKIEVSELEYVSVFGAAALSLNHQLSN